MEFHKDFEHCTGVFLNIFFLIRGASKCFEDKLKKHIYVEMFNMLLLKLISSQQMNVWFLKEIYFNCGKHVYNPFIGFVSVAPLVTWGWHGIFIVVKRDTPLLHLVSRVKLCQKFCDMGGTVSSICCFGSCKINSLQIPNVQLMVNCFFGARCFGIRIGVPLNNPFHTGIQSESKPPIHH